MPLKREIRHHTSVRSTRSMDEESSTTEDGIMSNIPSWFIVVVSLLFVVIFGGALIGGIVSGDPNNGFFVTSIIIASVLAISVALGVSIRYYLINRAKDDDEYLSKDDMRGTFSNSDEGKHQEEDSFNRRPDHGHFQTQPQPNHYLTHTHVESRIKEIQTKSGFGEMSVLSPQTYDEESLTTIGQGRRGFNFSSITASKRESKVNMREDPPEGAGSSTFQAAWNTRGHSQDPSAPKFSTDGEIITDDDIEHKIDIENTLENNDDENTVVTVKNDRYENCNDDEETVIRVKKAGNSSDLEIESSSKSGSRQHRRERRRSRSRSRSRSKSKSPSARTKSKSPSGSRSAKSPSSSETKTSSKRKQNLQNTDALRPPTSTKSGVTNSMTASSIPLTPAASETGSFASSFFKPLSGVFGKNKKTQSNAGASDIGSTHTTATTTTTTTTKHKDPIANDKVPVVNSKKGRPPMMPPSILKKVGDGDENNKGASNSRRGMETIGGRIGSIPSTPGNKSTFTIPPPRRIPQTPNGSVVFSEFQSVAGSAYSNGAASSTFDPQAHQRALQKMQKNEASIGANPIGGNAMPMYYEDDDDDDKESSVAPSAVLQSEALAYDVFAPPGAIGIVVDTNDKGCIVHSLKKSSPMQGLMNRGDLIIALDDFDVRNMSPASLTKLMAKKSQQAERKFTLIPSDFV